MQKKIAKVNIGSSVIHISLDTDRHSAYGVWPDLKSGREYVEIMIGIRFNDPASIVSSLIHEVMEIRLVEWGASYTNYKGDGTDAGGFTFMFSHATFTQVVTEVAQVVQQVLPELMAEWSYWKEHGKLRPTGKKKSARVPAKAEGKS